MNDRTRVLAAVGATVCLFLGVQLGALALVDPFTESGRQAVENPDDPTNSILYVGVMLVATGSCSPRSSTTSTASFGSCSSA